MDKDDRPDAPDDPVFETLEEAIAFAQNCADPMPDLIDFEFFFEQARYRGDSPAVLAERHPGFTLAECERILNRRVQVDDYGYLYRRH